MKKVITLLALLIPALIIAQKEINKIDSIVNSKIGENDPGLMIGIVKNGNVIYEKYRGLASLQHQVKVSEKTRSNIASTAKQYTALMILDLALNEKLDLEDDIRQYLPDLYENVDDKIRIRQVLNHTSGIRDYCDLMGIQNDIWWKKMGLKNEDVIELLEKQEDLAFTPGSQYTYSNSGYNVLAKIIEQVSGEKFTDYSKQFFIDLGMKETYFIERYMGVIPNRAEPYADWGEGVWLQTPTITKTAGEGFLYTTLKDQLIYEQAVQNANKSNNDLLIKSQLPIPNSEIKTYGFGLELKNQLNRKAVHHSGVTSGYHAQTIRFPEEELTVFIMSNNGNIRSDLIAKEIARVYLSEIPIEDKYNERLFDKSNNVEPQKILAQYRHPNGKNLVRIVENEGKTYWQEENLFYSQIVKEDVNTYSFTYSPKLKVVFYENEMIEYYQSGKTLVYKRIPTSPITTEDLECFIGTYYSSELEMSFELRLSEENKLKIKFSNRDNERDVEVFNRDELKSRNFILKTHRDQFDRITELFLDLGRAKNNRFKKKTNLKFQPKIETENGSIQVTTIASRDGDNADILLTKNDVDGNEIWFKQFGGNGYDKASSILATDDGYLIVGSTSSYGNGNYDMFIIKTDKQGKKEWQNTYGKFDNEYGYTVEKTNTGFLVKGTIQQCSSKDVLNRECTTNVWFVSIDKNGNELSNKVLEEI